MTKHDSGEIGRVVATIGHSTRALETFIHLLQTYDVKQVVDVRTVPRSRHNPQFNHETLPDDLRATGIECLHLPGLGGRMKPFAQVNGTHLVSPLEKTLIPSSLSV